MASPIISPRHCHRQAAVFSSCEGSGWAAQITHLVPHSGRTHGKCKRVVRPLAEDDLTASDLRTEPKLRSGQGPAGSPSPAPPTHLSARREDPLVLIRAVRLVVSGERDGYDRPLLETGQDTPRVAKVRHLMGRRRQVGLVSTWVGRSGRGLRACVRA
jgi:hypothetical protein